MTDKSPIDIKALVDSVLAGKDSNTASSINDWEEDPITYEEFIYSPMHVNFPKYSDRQLELPKFLFDFNNPKESFNNGHYLGILEYGKGSGKDTVCVHTVMYLIYLLLCHRKPASLFPGIAGESDLHIVNMAYDADQALVVFFSLLKNHILKWKWLKNKYYIYNSGTCLSSPPDRKSKEWVEIKFNTIIFPKGIHAESKHSGPEAIEGRNTIAAILDEIAAFPLTGESSGIDLFNNALSSGKSRFNNSFKMVAISYSRAADDCIQELIKENESNPDVFIDIASTFEVKPRSCFGDKWVDWVDPLSGITYNIPEPYLVEFKRDPVMAKCKYLCIPPSTKDAWIVYENAIHSSINTTRPQLFSLKEEMRVGLNKDKYMFKTITSTNYTPQGYDKFALSSDLSTTHDRAWLTLWGRVSNGSNPKYHQLFFTNWYPNQAEQIRVPIQNVQDIVTWICKESKLPIDVVVFDSFESSQCVQNLNLLGINAVIKTQVASEFEAWRNSLYNGELSHMFNADQTAEMVGLINKRQGDFIIPDHKELAHDDSFRTNCGAYLALSGLLKQKNQNKLALKMGGEVIQKFNPDTTDVSQFGEGSEVDEASENGEDYMD